MGLFSKNKKVENAIQVNDVNKAPILCGWDGVFPMNKPKKEFGETYLWICLSRITRGLSNVSFYSKSDNYVVKGICDFVMRNYTLLFNSYVKRGFVAVSYTKDYDYTILTQNDFKFDGFGRVINRDTVVVYSPEYQTSRKTPVIYCRPILDTLGDLCNTLVQTTNTMNVLPIISSNAIPASPKYKQDLSEAMSRDYGWDSGKLKYFLSQTEVHVDSVELGVDKLQLRDNILAKFKELLNYWDIPTPLVIDDASTYNNIEGARKEFYGSCVRYYAERMLELAQALLTASPVLIPKNTINYAFSNVPEMEKTISSYCQEQTTYLNLLSKFQEMGVYIEDDVMAAYEEMKRRIKDV